MTVWMFHESLTPEEEAMIQERSHLALPFEGLPDLSMITSPTECRHLLQALHPDAPPETTARKTERIWHLFSGLQAEDIIAVPLPARKEVAVAEITQPYQYGVDDEGHDVHQVAVKWHDRRAKFSAFRKHPEALQRREGKIHEIANPAVRVIIRDRLPHAYNRFVQWKWLLALFFIIGMYRHIESLIASLQ